VILKGLRRRSGEVKKAEEVDEVKDGNGGAEVRWSGLCGGNPSRFRTQLKASGVSMGNGSTICDYCQATVLNAYHSN
jgi:hypothetical protein